jgi:hypothetical protein
MSSTVSLSELPNSPPFDELETQILALQQLLKDQITCLRTCTYKCHPVASSIIWPVLFTIAIILLNLINCTGTKRAAEDVPLHTDTSSLPKDIISKEDELITTTNKTTITPHKSSAYANGF